MALIQFATPDMPDNNGFYHIYNIYLIGRDPTYLQLFNAHLYDLWGDITQIDVENPSRIIATTFDSR